MCREFLQLSLFNLRVDLDLPGTHKAGLVSVCICVHVYVCTVCVYLSARVPLCVS